MLSCCRRHPLIRARLATARNGATSYQWDLADDVDRDPVRVADCPDGAALDRLRAELYTPPIELMQTITRAYLRKPDPPDPLPLDQARDLGSFLVPKTSSERWARQMEGLRRFREALDSPSRIAMVGGTDRDDFGFVFRTLDLGETTTPRLMQRVLDVLGVDRDRDGLTAAASDVTAQRGLQEITGRKRSAAHTGRSAPQSRSRRHPRSAAIGPNRRRLRQGFGGEARRLCRGASSAGLGRVPQIIGPGGLAGC